VEAIRAARHSKPSAGPLTRNARQEERAAFLFLLPWLIGLLLFTGGPILAALAISLTDWNLLIPPRFVGSGNYVEMVSDWNFWQSVRVTLRYVVMSLPLYLVTGLALALLLNLKVKGIGVFRTILFLPSILPGVATAVLFVTLLNPDLGVVNWILRGIGVADPPRWFLSPTWAVPSVVLVGLWGIGGGAIIYLAGLQNINPQLYEAAAIDGAGPLRRFWDVTIPMLTPTLFFVLITSLIGAFQVFDTAFVLGGGSRGGTSESLLFYLLNLWNEGFRNGRLGYASALGWVLIVVAAIAILILFRTADRWVYYEAGPERG
jgi:multiple sugar transport system permease protein